MGFFGFLSTGGKQPAAAIDPAIQTAQQFVNVKDVRGSVLYTRDGQMMCYIRLQPVSVDLLSDREKAAFIRVMTAELSSERKPFRILSISRPVDINRQIAELMEMRAASHDLVQKDLLKEEIMLLSGFAMSGEVIERQFFIVLWEPYRAASDATADLIKRASEFIGKLKAGKVSGELCGQGEIIQLLNQMNNPAYAHIEDTDTSRGIPVLDIKLQEDDNAQTTA